MLRDQDTLDAPLGRAGHRIGPCELLELAGIGGMGAVYRARVVEADCGVPVGAIVALKVLHASLSTDPRARARFASEAAVGLRVADSHVVRTLASGEDSGGFPYLVQDWIDGVTLSDLVAEVGPLAEPLLRVLLSRVASGLAAIHRAGAIHRDLKPANIIITGEHGVRIVDLGVAALVNESSPLGQPVHGFVGSPRHAAPEQFDAGELTPAADLFALGATFYEAATGSSHATGAWSRRRIPARQRRPGLSAFFDVLLAALLQEDPAERLGDAARVASIAAEGESSRWWRDLAERRTKPPKGVRIRAARQGGPWRLVGREAELAECVRVLDRVREGAIGMVWIEGEAGIGKTRLLDELGDRLVLPRKGLPRPHVLRTRMRPHGPESDLLVTLAEHLVPGADTHALEACLAELLGESSPLAPAVARHLLGRPEAEGQHVTRSVLDECVVACLQRLAARAPIAWLIDDIHAASPDALSLVTRLAASLRGHDVLLVAARRPTPVVEAGHADGSFSLRLGRLGLDDARTLVGEALGSAAAARAIAPLMWERSGGLPFIILELLAHLGHAIDGSGQEELVMRARTMPVPRSIEEMLRRRLASVPSRLRHVLDAAAIQTADLDVAILARVLDRPLLSLLHDLADLERAYGLVRTAGAECRLDHDLLRDSLIGAMPQALQRELHRATAIAWRSRAETGDLGADGRDRAWRRFADHAIASSDVALACEAVLPALESCGSSRHAEILELGSRALAMLPDREELLDARIAIALQLWRTRSTVLPGSMEPSLLALLARAVGRRADLDIRATSVRASHAVHSGDVITARELAERSLALARESATDLVPRCIGALVEVEISSGRLATARELSVESLRISRARGLDDAAWHATTRLVNILRFQGEFAAAALLARDLSTSDEPSHRACSIMMEALCLADIGERGRALALCAEAGAWARRLRNRTEQASIPTTESFFHLEEGNLAEARAAALRAGRFGLSLMDAQNASYLADIARIEGATEAAHACIDDTLSLCSQSSLPQLQATAWLYRGLTLEAEGRYDEARRWLSASVEELQRQNFPQVLPGAQADFGRFLLCRGDTEAARPLLRTALAAHARHPWFDPGAMPAAALAVLGDMNPGLVTIDRRSGAMRRAESLALLFRATGSASHEAAARRELDHLSRHLTGAARAAFWSRNLAARLLSGHAFE